MSRLSAWASGPIEQQGSAQHTQQEAKVFDGGMNAGGPPGLGGGWGGMGSADAGPAIVTAPGTGLRQQFQKL